MNLRPIFILLPLAIATVVSASAALAQDKGNVDPKPLPPLANPKDPKLGAKELFGRKVLPAAMPTRVVGFYAKGCIAGAQALPIDGETWQVMRLSRNRNWAHPDMVALLKRLAGHVHKDAGWPGIFVGDMSPARGGDVHRPRQSSGGTRRRHLVNADAGPPIVAQRARGNVRGDDGACRPARYRSERLDGEPPDADPRRRAGAERAARLRQCRDQESAVPRSQGRPQLAFQSAADVRPRLPFPYPHQMPAGQHRMRKPAGADGRRGLQHRGPGLLVQG